VLRYADEKGRWVTLENEQRVYISGDHLMPSGPDGKQKSLREKPAGSKEESGERRRLTSEQSAFLEDVRKNPAKVEPAASEVVGGRKPELVSSKRKTQLDVPDKKEPGKPAAVFEAYKPGEALPDSGQEMTISFYKSKGGVSDGKKSYVAEINGRNLKYGLEREFLNDPDDKDWSDYDYKKKKGTYSFIFTVPKRGGIYEVCDRDEKEISIYFPGKENGKHKMFRATPDQETLKSAFRLLEKAGHSASDLISAMILGKAAGINGMADRVQHYIDSKRDPAERLQAVAEVARYSLQECEDILRYAHHTHHQPRSGDGRWVTLENDQHIYIKDGKFYPHGPGTKPAESSKPAEPSEPDKATLEEIRAEKRKSGPPERPEFAQAPISGDTDKMIAQLAKMPTKELRRRQDIIEKQIEDLNAKSSMSREHKEHALKRLQTIQEHLAAAVDKREFAEKSKSNKKPSAESKADAAAARIEAIREAAEKRIRLREINKARAIGQIADTRSTDIAVAAELARLEASENNPNKDMFSRWSMVFAAKEAIAESDPALAKRLDDLGTAISSLESGKHPAGGKIDKDQREELRSKVEKDLAAAEQAAEPGNVEEAQKEKFFELARRRRGLEQAKYRSWSGADKSDAELHRLEAGAFVKLGQGEPLDAVLGKLENDWKEFASEQNKKVESASKIKRGPMSGSSAAHYKWADPGRVDSSLVFLRNMYKDIMSKPEKHAAANSPCRYSLADCRDLIRYDAQAEKGRWITVESGTHLFVGKGGEIDKGPAGLKGKKIGEVDQDKPEKVSQDTQQEVDGFKKIVATGDHSRIRDAMSKMLSKGAKALGASDEEVAAIENREKAAEEKKPKEGVASKGLKHTQLSPETLRPSQDEVQGKGLRHTQLSPETLRPSTDEIKGGGREEQKSKGIQHTQLSPQTLRPSQDEIQGGTGKKTQAEPSPVGKQPAIDPEAAKWLAEGPRGGPESKVNDPSGTKPTVAKTTGRPALQDGPQAKLYDPPGQPQGTPTASPAASGSPKPVSGPSAPSKPAKPGFEARRAKHQERAAKKEAEFAGMTDDERTAHKAERDAKAAVQVARKRGETGTGLAKLLEVWDAAKKSLGLVKKQAAGQKAKQPGEQGAAGSQPTEPAGDGSPFAGWHQQTMADRWRRHKQGGTYQAAEPPQRYSVFEGDSPRRYTLAECRDMLQLQNS